jgi:hypothetical protein
MPVLAENHSRVELDACLHDLASGSTEIVALEIDAPRAGLLRWCHVQPHRADHDQRCHGRDLRCFHRDLLSL